MRGYKVSDARRRRLCGVACSSLEQLKKKGGEKLKIPLARMLVQTLDGTIIDDEDYFQTLPAQSVLILLKPGEHVVTGADLIYSALTAINSEYLRAGRLAQEFLATDLRDKVRQFTAIVDRHEPSIAHTTRVDDPAWFEGLDTRARTKERYMFVRSQERIRGYYYKTADEVRKSEAYRRDGKARSFLDAMLEEFRKTLRRHEDFGCLFDRSREGRLSDGRGEFLCQGRWDKEECLYETRHRINPYESREARIVFSTWNLDHGVERTRTVIPALLAASTRHLEVASRSYRVLCDNAFCLLFTRENLKLVNIVCHDKGAHTGLVNRHYETIKQIANARRLLDNKTLTIIKT